MALTIIKLERFSQPCQIESTRALFLDTTRGLTVPQMSSVFTTTSTAPPKQFFRIFLVSQSIVLQFLKELLTQLGNWSKDCMVAWFQYIDDKFFTWNRNEDELNKFLENLNNFKINLKLTYEISKDSIHFLDLNVSIIVCTIW